MQQPILIGDRIYLSPRIITDADDRARWKASEPDDYLYDGGRQARSPLEYQNEIRGESSSIPPQDIVLSVRLVESNAHIGTMELCDIDWINRTAETGSYLSPEGYRGSGYGTEAKMLLLEYAFDTLHLHMVYSLVYGTNQRSAAALFKQGYRSAGRLRWISPSSSVYQDELLFDLKRDEWLEARERWRKERPGHS